MQTTIDLPHAGVSLADLIQRAMQGDDIVIADAGTPLVRLVPIMPLAQPRILGLDAGTVIMSDDFDDELPDSFWLGEDETSS